MLKEPPDCPDEEYPITNKRRLVLRALEATLVEATGVCPDEAAEWPQQSQLFLVDRDWHMDTSKWIRETAIAIGDLYECAVWWIRWWNRLRRYVDSQAHDLDDYTNIGRMLDHVLRDVILANAEVQFAMVRWAQTEMYDIHGMLDEGTVGTYRLVVPDHPCNINDAAETEVRHLLERVGTSWCRNTSRIPKHFCSLLSGARLVKSSVNSLRRPDGRERGLVLVKVWREFVRLYSWSPAMAASAVVLLDESDRLFLSRPRRLSQVVEPQTEPDGPWKR